MKKNMLVLDKYVWHPVKRKFVEWIEFLEDSLTDERLTTKQELPYVVQHAVEKQL
ncbi:hypothetical protein [Aeromonas sp. 604534]|uniref:hypothetical protein n=1 Tax=Aeromonas sp. 604534 TaxID=2712055 RepID=UPI003BA0C8F8